MKIKTENNVIPKLRDVRGVSRAVVIMIVAVSVMLVAVSIPVYIHFRGVWREMKCMTSLDSAKRQMIDEFLLQNSDLTMEEAKEHVGYVMNGWDDLCPGGGIVYIVPDENAEDTDIPYKLVCGIHGPDAKERTRLNANYVLEKVSERVRLEKEKDAGVPESVEITLNGEKLTACLVTEDQDITCGTDYIKGKKGTVAYYGVGGKGSVGDISGAAENEVCWFSFADKLWCANWNSERGWSGDAWD